MADETERWLARFRNPDIWVEDHGCLMVAGHFEGERGAQGLGYALNEGAAEFLKRLLAVFRVEKLSQCANKPCWVTGSNSRIDRLEPLLPEEGVPFDIQVWAKETSR